MAANAIHLALFIACLGLAFGSGVLVRRAKQSSLRWQERSDRQQLFLSRLPGTIIAVAIYAAVIFLTPL